MTLIVINQKVKIRGNFKTEIKNYLKLFLMHMN